VLAAQLALLYGNWDYWIGCKLAIYIWRVLAEYSVDLFLTT
jgi:hypothetical protein